MHPQSCIVLLRVPFSYGVTLMIHNYIIVCLCNIMDRVLIPCAAEPGWGVYALSQATSGPEAKGPRLLWISLPKEVLQWAGHYEGAISGAERSKYQLHYLHSTHTHHSYHFPILPLQDIISHNCHELVTSVPFFQNASPQFVTAVLMKLKFEVFLKGDYIIHAGTKGDRMYFIRSGTVDVLINDETVATSLSDGSHFGEICLLTDDRRVATIRAATTCDLFSLSKKHFQAILEEYPEMRCAMEAIALRRLSKIGKKPPLEEIKKKGRISTTIEPPHISRNVSHEFKDGKGKEKADSYDDNQPCSSHSQTPKRKKISTVTPPHSPELHTPSPPLGRAQPQNPLPSLPPLKTRPELPPIAATRTVELQRQVKDPNFVNYSDDSSCESEATVWSKPPIMTKLYDYLLNGVLHVVL